jgi:hypothetical protein
MASPSTAWQFHLHGHLRLGARVTRGKLDKINKEMLKQFKVKHWSQLFDAMAKRYSDTQVRAFKKMLREQTFPGASVALNKDYKQRKRDKKLDLRVLIATNSIIDSIVQTKIGQGTYEISFDGMSSTPFGGKRIRMGALLTILELGGGRFPARPFIEYAKERASKTFHATLKGTMRKVWKVGITNLKGIEDYLTRDSFYEDE